jgi:DNA-binding NtrC family response regulator
MVVEDEPDILRLVEIYLTRWGFLVDAFTDPINALAHFKLNISAYSLVLSDVRMPGINGVELAQKLLELSPTIKVVLMTAFDILDEELKANLPMIKQIDILRKPFKLLQVCTAVKKQLQLAD